MWMQTSSISTKVYVHVKASLSLLLFNICETKFYCTTNTHCTIVVNSNNNNNSDLLWNFKCTRIRVFFFVCCPEVEWTTANALCWMLKVFQQIQNDTVSKRDQSTIFVSLRIFALQTKFSICTHVLTPPKDRSRKVCGFFTGKVIKETVHQ